jgi:hypothetical protein
MPVNARNPKYPTSSPTAPPVTDKRRASVSSCERILRRLAPNAARIAISCLRPVALAITRFATLAHAIRNTQLTAAMSTRSGRRTSPTVASHSGSAVKTSCGARDIPHVGNFRRNCSCASFICAFAISKVIPGTTRAATRMVCAWLVLNGSACIGSRTSADGSGAKPGPSTPITVYGSLPSTRALPTRVASPPKRRSQSVWVITTTRGPFGRSSSAVKMRPTSMGAPNRRKYSAETWSALSCSGSMPVKLMLLGEES